MEGKARLQHVATEQVTTHDDRILGRGVAEQLVMEEVGRKEETPAYGAIAETVEPPSVVGNREQVPGKIVIRQESDAAKSLGARGAGMGAPAAAEAAQQNNPAWRRKTTDQHLKQLTKPKISRALFPWLPQEPQGVVQFLDHAIDWNAIMGGAQEEAGPEQAQQAKGQLSMKLLQKIQAGLGKNKLTPEQLTQKASLSGTQRKAISRTLAESGIPLVPASRVEEVIYAQTTQVA